MSISVCCHKKYNQSIYFAIIYQTLSSSAIGHCFATLDHSEMLLLLWLCLYS
ncbi:hypothetical protein BCV72DRAFT_231752 [Rhizopus microsporus var. microsporus]|uniref:Uncharacterized protein n=1 Tax=Rhizopus microsporus var. microsporus TaxID=86635 RepID=A0A1X0QX52_RHIZD|nr:hypothetical protein BCV72DRAFT_231752 [Rhizopus microsporus var. microsporus]